MKQITIEKAVHRHTSVLCIRFERDRQMEAALRNLEGCRWSQTMRCWYVKNIPDNLRAALKALRPYGHVDFSAVVNKVQPTGKVLNALPVKEGKFYSVNLFLKSTVFRLKTSQNIFGQSGIVTIPLKPILMP
jgi:hypothetical protein